MASIDDEIRLRANISSLESRIVWVEETQEEVQTALERGGSYRGMSNQAELTAVLQALFKKEEHLRTKEEQLRDEMLLWRRIHDNHNISRATGDESTAAGVPSTGPTDQASPSSSMSDLHSTSTCDGESVASAEAPTEFSVNVYIDAPGANTEHFRFGKLPSTYTAWDLQQLIQRRTGLSETSLRFETDTKSVHERLERESVPGILKDVHVVRTDDLTESSCVCFVRSLTGKTLVIRGNFPAMTGLTLKSMVRAQVGYPIGAQRLVCGSRSLEDHMTLLSCGVDSMSTVDCMFRLCGGKPVILLYPPNQLEASVRVGLSSDWSFSALYPKPSNEGLPQSEDSARACGRECQWRVRAHPNGSLLDLQTGKKYPYLFWEADSADGRVVRRFDLDGTPSFCVAGDKAGALLDDALMRLGLNMRERCDMITYWLLQLEAYPFNAIYFVDVQRYAQAAKLDIVPVPDVIIRVFMAFRGLETYDAQLDTAELGDLQAPAREGFVAVEWGGMNLNGPV